MSLFERIASKIKEDNIRFEHVCFSYDGKHQILDDISFSVQGENHCPFVGQPQVREIVCINVLMRFLYEFQSGRVLLDGVDIRNY